MHQLYKIFCLLILFGISKQLYSQDSLAVQTDSLAISLDSLSQDSSKIILDQPPIEGEKDKKRPEKSLGYSAMYPGLGQINNNQIYKTPVFAGLFTTSLVYAVKQRADYSKFRKAYTSRFDDEILEIQFPEYSDAQLLDQRIKSKRKYNLALGGSIFIYSLNLMDAFASAQIKKNKRSHSPVIAAYRSAILPGWGQAYNKKKWKIPIIYGGLAVGGYFLYDNFTKMNSFTNAYVFIDDPTFVPDPIVTNLIKTTITEQKLLTGRDLYRNRFEISIFLTTAMYLLNIIDATVDGHLFEFDQEMMENEDLSFQISPFIEPTAQRETAYGLSLSLKF